MHLDQPESAQTDRDASGRADNGAPQRQPAFGAPVTPDPTVQWQPAYSESGSGTLDPTMQWAPSAVASAQYEPTLQWQPRLGDQLPQSGHAATTQSPSNATASTQGAYMQDNGAQFGGPSAPAFPQVLGPSHPQRDGPRKTLLAAGVAALVVAGGATAAVMVADSGSDDTTARSNSPSMVSALTPTGDTPPLTTTPEPAAPADNATPVVPGYQAVVASDLGAAYDVPADWTVAPDGKVGGFGTPPDAVTGKGLATEGKSYCPGSTRTVAFMTGSKDTDSATAATDLGTRTARIAYSTGGTPGVAQPLTSLDGSQNGMFVETKGTATQVKPGCATEYSVYTFATPTNSGSFVMVIAADTGVPNAVDPDTAKRIFTSIRPHDG